MTGIEIVGAVLVLAPIVVKLLDLLNAKAKNEKTKAVAQAAADAITFVEETAAEIAKSNPELAKKGAEKLEAARVEFQKKYPKVPIAEAEKIIKTVLPKLGLGAASKKLRGDITGALNGE